MTVTADALRDAVQRKHRESVSTQERFFAENSAAITRCAEALAHAFAGGGKLLVLGNGGSACDAQHIAVEFMHPVLEKRVPLPALALATDPAFLTAVGNDEDFSLAFSKQLRLLGHAGDVALGISTSGQSRNVLRALQGAREAKLVTVGFAGRDGGRMREVCDHAFVVPSFSIHRIQETHVALLHILWDLVHLLRGEEDVL